MAEEVAPSDDYTLEDWVKIWKDYDMSKPRKVTQELKDYFKELLPYSNMSVFLPLCGVTPDIRWLYDKGHTVVGLDGVELPIKVLVSRNKDLRFKKETLERDNAIKYTSEDGRMTLIVSDVLEYFVRDLGPFDAVFDYGAYTAIRPVSRKKYIFTVFSTLKTNYRYILEFCHDVSPDCEDHPCVISYQTLKKEVGLNKHIRVLKTLDVSDVWGAEAFFNSFVFITPKEKSYND